MEQICGRFEKSEHPLIIMEFILCPFLKNPWACHVKEQKSDLSVNMIQASLQLQNLVQKDKFINTDLNKRHSSVI